jgi:hypothetical protein
MMGMAEIFGAMAAAMVMAPLALIGAFIPVVIYVVARWRHTKEHQVADPQLGMKTALHLFRVIGLQVSLVGGFLCAWGILTTESRGVLLRIGLGFLLPGLIAWGAHKFLSMRTNGAIYPNVERMFDGWNLVQTGLLGFFALLILFVMLLQEGEAGEPGRMAWAFFLVYFLAWLVLGFLQMRKHALLSPAAGAATVPPHGAQQGHGQPGYPPQAYAPDHGGHRPQGGGWDQGGP